MGASFAAGVALAQPGSTAYVRVLPTETLLELALLLSGSRFENTLRFAWWAAEEQGLVGSNSYVGNLVPGKMVPGSRSLKLPEPGGPAGTVGSGGSGH